MRFTILSALLCATAAALAACGGGEPGDVSKDVPMREKRTIRQFAVSPLPVEKLKPCDLISPENAEELGVVSPDRGPGPRGAAHTPTTCFWANGDGESVALQIHNDTDSVRIVVLNDNVDLIRGYPAAKLPIGISCIVYVAVSDSAYLTFQVISQDRAGPCALGVRAAQHVLAEMQPV
ncbi:DUF3558 family protein [Lentzea sp. NPDC051208]|uniref:DUF3558 family protein n=1 Tax=Lentzea sp. NPDC051208 TaxID=3154642 RepID=UPI003448B277